MPLTSASCLITAGQGGWEGRRDNELLGRLGEHGFDAGNKEQSFTSTGKSEPHPRINLLGNMAKPPSGPGGEVCLEVLVSVGGGFWQDPAGAGMGR